MLREQNSVIVADLVHTTGKEHAPLNAELNRKVGIRRISEATVRITWGAWNVPQTVNSPLILSKEATHWQVSSGQGWTR